MAASHLRIGGSMTTTVLLEASGVEPLYVAEVNGYIIRRLDLGDAETRAVVLNAPDANGTIDTTALTGARTVHLAVRLVPRNGYVPDLLVRRLRDFTAARLRPVMTYQRDGTEGRMVLRRGPFTAPIEQATHRDVTVQWVVPSGIVESSALNTVIIFAGAAGVELGRAYSVEGTPQGLVFDRDYPTSPIIGSATAYNAGNEVAYPLLRIYGPCTNPVVINVTQGKTLAFTGLTILAGEFVEVDTRNKTIRYNGLASDSRYNTLVFPTSAWLALLPGANLLRFTPATSAPPSHTEVTWRDAYL